MEQAIKHIPDGKSTWIISKDGRIFYIEFSISETPVTKQRFDALPLKEVSCEPAVIVLTANIKNAKLNIGKNDKIDWIGIILFPSEKQEIIDYIELNYKL